MHGNDDYPEDLIKAYHMLNEYQHWTPKKQDVDTNSVAFAQAEKEKKEKEKQNGGSGGRNNTNWHKTMTCHNCGKKGHIKPNCPEFDKDKDDKADKEKIKKLEGILKKKEEAKKTVTFVQHESDSEDDMGFVNLANAQVNKPQVDLYDMVLLDNQLMMDIFCNP